MERGSLYHKRLFILLGSWDKNGGASTVDAWEEIETSPTLCREMHKYLHYKPDAHKASKIDLEVNIFLTRSKFLLIFRYIQYFQFSPIHETKILSFSQRKNTYLV